MPSGQPRSVGPIPDVTSRAVFLGVGCRGNSGLAIRGARDNGCGNKSHGSGEASIEGATSFWRWESGEPKLLRGCPSLLLVGAGSPQLPACFWFSSRLRMGLCSADLPQPATTQALPTKYVSANLLEPVSSPSPSPRRQQHRSRLPPSPADSQVRHHYLHWHHDVSQCSTGGRTRPHRLDQRPQLTGIQSHLETPEHLHAGAELINERPPEYRNP